MLLNDHLSEKELLIRFTARAFRKLVSIYVFSYFTFSFEGRMWDLIVSVPDHCLSFYFRSLDSEFLLDKPNHPCYRRNGAMDSPISVIANDSFYFSLYLTFQQLKFS